MPAVKVMIALFPYGHVIDDRLAKYIVKLSRDLDRDPRVMQYAIWQESDTPITHLRNRCLVDAEEKGFDFVIMLDSDNLPDLYLGSDKNAKPFWQSSFDFALDNMARKGVPSVIAAPYCGPSPHSCCYVFDWVNFRNPKIEDDVRNVACDFALEMVPRHEAAQRTGIQPAAALPTGVILIDMRAVKPLPHPRFDYEWTCPRQIKKASTEDVYFTRNLAYAWQDHGDVLFCNWDSWAGHVKLEVVGKPQNYPQAWIPNHLVKTCREALKVGRTPDTNGTPQPNWLVRQHNSYQAPPKSVRLDLVRTRETVVVPSEGEFPEDEAEAVVLNGQG